MREKIIIQGEKFQNLFPKACKILIVDLHVGS